MAQILENTDRQESIEDIVNELNHHDFNELWQDEKIRSIFKAITWPRPLTAIKYTLETITASTIIGLLLYVYGYGINQLIALFQ